MRTRTGHRVNLAVSLHAADDAIRSRLMPVNRKYGIDEVLAACRAYPLSKRQVIFIEYLLIDGLNDAAADARGTGRKAAGHPLPGQPAALQRVAVAPLPRFAAGNDRRLSGYAPRRGFRTLIRTSRGADIAAACGQLAPGASERASGEAATTRHSFRLARLRARVLHTATLHGRP